MLVSFVVTVIIFRCAPLVLERHATEWALVVPFLHTRVVRFPHVAVEGAIGEGVDRHGRIELGAILGIDRNITEGASLYVARVGKDYGFRLSKPCAMCTAAMEHVGIKRVYWTIDNHNCAMGKL